MQRDGLDDNLRLTGKRDAGGEWQFLRCGPLTAYFDPETTALRRICLGETEILRSVYVAVRDHNWNTIAPHLTDVQLTRQDGGFHLTFRVQHRERNIDFAWRGEITGEASGRIRFQMDGKSLSAFRRNRIGFCLLHPVPACVGKPCVVQTTDGHTERGLFPNLISPHQPFQNMRSIRHEAAPDVWAEVTFEGDVFEMEDQRNWTDASYKTYCTPLALPYPVLVPAETEIKQAVLITLISGMEVQGIEEPVFSLREGTSGNSKRFKMLSPSRSRRAHRKTWLRLTDAPPCLLPHIGLGIASHGEPLSNRQTALLRELNLSHLRLDLTPSQIGWQAKLQQAGAEAQAIGAELEIALFLTDDAQSELTQLADALPALPCPVVRWIIFHVEEKVTRPQWVQMARQALSPLTPAVPIGAGTNAYFAELNRERPDLDRLDCVSYSLNPQVHAFDDASLVENLQGQADTVRSAQAFCGDVPIVVSPVTLRPRFNPNATGNDAPPDPNVLPFEVDTRQMSLFGAGWTLGSLKALCEAGAHSATYYETTGWRGVMETDAGSPLPKLFPSTPGTVFPLYDVLQSIGQFAGGTLQSLTSSDPLRVVGMVLQKERRQAVLCANMTGKSQSVYLTLPPTVTHLKIWQMDAENVGKAFILEPVQVLRVENGAVEWELSAYAFAHADMMEWTDTKIQTLPHGDVAFKNRDKTMLRGGLIGCGFFARNQMYAWNALPDAQIVAVCDTDPARARTFARDFSVPQIYTDAAQMLQAENLDFVDIVTQPATHRALVELAAAHHVPVICQKPLALTLEDAHAMVQACESANVPFMVHENFRWQSPMRALKAAAADIGDLFFGRISFRTPYDVYANQPYLATEPRFIIADLGVHVLDLARFFGDEAASLTCLTQRVNPNIVGEDAATILLKMQSAATCLVDFSYATNSADDPFPQTFVHLEGTRGKVTLGRDYRLDVDTGVGGKIITSDVPPQVFEWSTPPFEAVQESVVAIQHHWIECLRKGTTPATSGADNLRTLELVFGAYQSAEQNTPYCVSSPLS